MRNSERINRIPWDGPSAPVPERCVARLVSYIESKDYAGYDPYDALNSPILRGLGAPSKWLRIGATQFLRRCPVNARPILGIRRGHNPKGIGLCLWGYARLYALNGSPQHLERIHYLLDLLERLRCRGYSGNCWGYNFDWQNRVMFVPKHTPTLVNSTFIGHALLDTYELCHIDRALEMAASIRHFLLNDLNRRCEDDRFCFSYTPIDSNFVHNANVLGASLLIRLHRPCEDPELERTATASVRYSLACQRADGAWHYAETAVQKWVDSFHTGFILQALRYFMAEGYDSLCRPAYDRGLAYYRTHFFLPDGTPKYFDNKVFPIDIHSPCQALIVFSGGPGRDLALAGKIAAWMLRHMYNPRGYFYFQKTRFFTNRIPYMRWSQAWAFHALTSFLYARITQARSY